MEGYKKSGKKRLLEFSFEALDHPAGDWFFLKAVKSPEHRRVHIAYADALLAKNPQFHAIRVLEDGDVVHQNINYED